MLLRSVSRFAFALFLAIAVPVTASADTVDPDLDTAANLMVGASEAGVLSAADASVIGDALSAALASGHRGLESAALRLVITYGEAVALDGETMLNVVRIYRDHKDLRMRRMAIVAIGATNDAWAMQFLERSLSFEGSKELSHTIRAVIEA